MKSEVLQLEANLPEANLRKSMPTSAGKKAISTIDLLRKQKEMHKKQR